MEMSPLRKTLHAAFETRRALFYPPLSISENNHRKTCEVLSPTLFGYFMSDRRVCGHPIFLKDLFLSQYASRGYREMNCLPKTIKFGYRLTVVIFFLFMKQRFYTIWKHYKIVVPGLSSTSTTRGPGLFQARKRFQNITPT